MRDGSAEETRAYHAIREKLHHKLHHPGHPLDFKAKELIGPDQTLFFSSQSKVRSI